VLTPRDSPSDRPFPKMLSSTTAWKHELPYKLQQNTGTKIVPQSRAIRGGKSGGSPAISGGSSARAGAD
jgi:hypothetical protein